MSLSFASMIFFLLRVAVKIMRFKSPDFIDFRIGFIANRDFILGGNYQSWCLLVGGTGAAARPAAGLAEGSAAGMAAGTAARTATRATAG